MTIEFQRLRAVIAVRGYQRSAHYEQIRRGLFTRPVRLGGRAVAWPSHEVQAINAARLAGKKDDEIRELVAQLEAARKAAA